MKRKVQDKISLNRETVRMLDSLRQVTAAGIFSVGCAPTVTCTGIHKTCDSCLPC